MVAWRNVALAALVMVVAKPLVASAKTIDEEPDIMCEQDGGWAELSPLGLEGASAFNVSNVTDTNWGELAVMDLVLYVDVAEIMLPNGMLVRVITADYVAFELDLSLEGLMDVQQSLWEIVIGNLLGTLICCVASGILIALEKEFKCIGGTELHDMIDKQHQLHDDLHHATVFLEQVQNNPDSLTGKGRALALGYQQLLANAEFGQLKDTVAGKASELKSAAEAKLHDPGTAAAITEAKHHAHDKAGKAKKHAQKAGEVGKGLMFDAEDTSSKPKTGARGGMFKRDTADQKQLRKE